MTMMKSFSRRAAGALIAGLAAAALAQQPVETQVITPPENVPGIALPVRILRGVFTSDVTLTNNTFWVLRGPVFVEAPARLTIEPGTQIIGETATRGTLVINRGAQIFANGTREQPIIFNSDQPDGSRGRGDWGGVVINGRAPVNLPGGVGIGEGDTGVYGGDDPNDNSGVIRFVRVQFGGIEFSPDNELNGIAFQGVGRGTTVEFVQVSFNKDDCLEWFGGTVDIKHFVVVGCGDDSVDWTFGWTGRMQFGIVQQRGDDADRGIEADNNANNNDLLPRSSPTIFNLTLIGDPIRGAESTDGIRFREGTAGRLHNFILIGFKIAGLDVRNNSTLGEVAGGRLVASHGLVFGNGRNVASGANTLLDASNGTIVQADPRLIDPFNQGDPDFRPAPNSPALLLPTLNPPNDGFFEIAPYYGGLGPDPEDDWLAGWTDFLQD